MDPLRVDWAMAALSCLGVPAFALAGGCGGRAQLVPAADAATYDTAEGNHAERGGDDDAAVIVDAGFPNPDSGAACNDSSYFIEVNDEAGSRVLRSGCKDSVPTVWGMFSGGQSNFYVTACGLGVSMRLVIPGGSNSWDYYDDGEGGTLQYGIGPIHFINGPPQITGLRTGLPWEGGPVEGDYSALFGPMGPQNDAAALKPMSGRFCLKW